jgi:hypothetical protein
MDAKTGEAERVVGVVLPASVHAELRREALRRVEDGESRRVSVSALVREALDGAPWRRLSARR